jgi:hypothetical protein
MTQVFPLLALLGFFLNGPPSQIGPDEEANGSRLNGLSPGYIGRQGPSLNGSTFVVEGVELPDAVLRSR